MRKITSRTITIRTGTEGASWDPYGYSELTVKTNLKEVTVHIGLGLYLKINKMKDKDTEYAETLIYKAFERHVGCSYRSIVRAYYRLRHFCPHCKRKVKHFYPTNRHPGETLYICPYCHNVAHADFHLSAIE